MGLESLKRRFWSVVSLTVSTAWCLIFYFLSNKLHKKVARSTAVTKSYMNLFFSFRHLAFVFNLSAKSAIYSCKSAPQLIN